MEFLVAAAYLILGLIVGFVAGAFGLGGGVIMVPAFLFLFKFHGFTNEMIPLLSIGTSLFASALASSAGTYRHLKNRNLNVQIGLLFGIFAVIASSSLSFVAVSLPAETLKLIFGCVLILITARLFMKNGLEKIGEEKPAGYSYWLAPLFGGIVGSLSAFAGVGGGIIAVPILHFIFKLPFKKAIGTSNLIIIFSTLAAAVSYIISGLQRSNLPEFTFGYVFLHAGFPAGIGAILSAGKGAQYSFVSQNRKLKILFALFIIVVDVKIFFDVLS
jgi:uncharacterized membrane protein YfcA